MNFQAKHTEPGIVQTAADDFKRGKFLGDKEHCLAFASAAAIRFVMVCDLPVPGGPSMTRFCPRSA